MPCEILTIAVSDRHANVVQAAEEIVTQFKADHGMVRARISKIAATGFIQSLADSTHGSQNGLDPGALFELGGVQFFQWDEIAAENEAGVPVLCELECLEHTVNVAEPKKKGWPKGKPRSKRVADGGQPDRTASPKDRDTADHALDSVPSVLSPLVSTATEVGLVLEPGMTWDQYNGIAQGIGRANRGMQWWAGDIAQYGEAHFGEQYAQILDDLGYEMETIANCKWVCGRFPIERRRKGLKFRHHAEVASMKPETADQWLERAENAGWTGNELRAQILAIKEITATESDKPKRGRPRMPKGGDAHGRLSTKPEGDKATAAPPSVSDGAAVRTQGEAMAGKKLSLKKPEPVASPAATPGIAGMAKVLTEYQAKIDTITDASELFEELKVRTSDSGETLLGLSAALNVLNQDIGELDINEVNLKMLRDALKAALPALVLMDRIADRAIRMVEESGVEG